METKFDPFDLTFDIFEQTLTAFIDDNENLKHHFEGLMLCTHAMQNILKKSEFITKIEISKNTTINIWFGDRRDFIPLPDEGDYMFEELKIAELQDEFAHLRCVTKRFFPNLYYLMQHEWVEGDHHADIFGGINANDFDEEWMGLTPPPLRDFVRFAEKQHLLNLVSEEYECSPHKKKKM